MVVSVEKKRELSRMPQPTHDRGRKKRLNQRKIKGREEKEKKGRKIMALASCAHVCVRERKEAIALAGELQILSNTSLSLLPLFD